MGHSSNAGICLHVRTQKRSSQRAPKFEALPKKTHFCASLADSMSSGYGHQTPTGRCFPVFMVRRPGLERQRSCSRDFLQK